MHQATREELLTALDDGWGALVDHFHSLPQDEQAAYLERQGYARLPDLLAHVIAWWELAIPRISVLLADPDCPGQEVDVDGFNAAAVARFRDCDEPSMVALFETTRNQLRNLIVSLPEAAFDHHRVNERLSMETIGHLSEHAFR